MYWASSTAAINSIAALDKVSLYVDYYFMDSDERRRFAQSAHEYLIDQLQFPGDETATATTKIKMNFNHPVKELIWVAQQDSVTTGIASEYCGPQIFNWTDNYDHYHKDMVAAVAFSGISTDPAKISDVSDLLALVKLNSGSTTRGGENPVTSCRIQLNGQDRFSERSGVYFNVLQPWQYHETAVAKGINVFSFAIKPEDYQPSGTCNMSRIDTAQLQLQLHNGIGTTPFSGRVKVFATNYNVLRIMSGMGGLAYAN
jgi:hypothetical protein